MLFTQKTLYIAKRERKQRRRKKKKKKKKKKNVSTMASYLSETGRCRPRSEDVAVVVVVVVVVGTYDDSMMSFWSSQNAAFCGIPISQLRCCSRAMMTTTIPKGIMRDSLLLGDFCVFFFSEFLSAFVCLFVCVLGV